MRIAMFEDTYLPKIDGVNKSVELFRDELRKRGHEVMVIAPCHPDANFTDVDDDTFLLPAVKTEFLYPGSSLGKFWTGMGKGRLARAFEQRRPDILHSHTEFTIGLWMASYWRTKLGHLGTRRVHTWHTLWTEYLFYLPLPEAVTQPLVRYLAPRVTKKRFDGVIAPTELMREALINDWGITNQWAHIDVVPTGIDITQFSRGDNARFRAKYNIGPDENVILYLGRLGTEKNVELAVHTFAELKRRNQENVRFVIAGGGPDAYVTKLRTLVTELGLQNDVVWTGFVRGADWLDAYAAADLLLFPSVTETQGLVVVEALAAGVPLVSVEAMGPASTMKGEKGCLFANADAVAFADATQRLLRDQVLYERKKREALEIARNSSVEHRTDELLAVYERVLQQPPSSKATVSSVSVSSASPTSAGSAARR